jgi:membrane protease YdiL (CAAX protease family)
VESLFALLLVVENFINAFMEAGLFRGSMIPLFLTKLSFGRTNSWQAFLFGAWHFNYLQLGTIQTRGEIGMSAFLNFMPQMLIGLVWGYMYFKTNSMWVPWISHVINNATLNLLPINTLPGMDSGSMIYTILTLLSMFIIKFLAEKFQMEEVQPWQMIPQEEKHPPAIKH